jgi:hypothetical protein
MQDKKPVYPPSFPPMCGDHNRDCTVVNERECYILHGTVPTQVSKPFADNLLQPMIIRHAFDTGQLSM